MQIIQLIPANAGAKAQIKGQMSCPIEFWALVEDSKGERSVQGIVLNQAGQNFQCASELPGFLRYLR